MSDMSSRQSNLASTLHNLDGRSYGNLKQIRGRYPVGITELDAQTSFPASYTDVTTVRADIDPRSRELLGFSEQTEHVATVTLATGSQVKVGAVDTERNELPASEAGDAAQRAQSYSDDVTSREVWAKVLPLVLLPLVLVLGAFWLAGAPRRRAPSAPPRPAAARVLAGADS